MSRVAGFHRTAGAIRKVSDADAFLRRVAVHLRENPLGLAYIAGCMLQLPLWRTEEQYLALNRMRKIAVLSHMERKDEVTR